MHDVLHLMWSTPLYVLTRPMTTLNGLSFMAIPTLFLCQDRNIKGGLIPLVILVCSVSCIVYSFTFCLFLFITIQQSILYTMDFNQRILTLQHLPRVPIGTRRLSEFVFFLCPLVRVRGVRTSFSFLPSVLTRLIFLIG
jgi:hypothetical protein